ncbi:MAG: cytochrome C oxidase subunit IV family protein [Terracidiphilus sp.]|jgi:cytochrome c oxidase subunit 4
MSEPNEHAHHIVGPKVYVTILFALLLGTALTVGASFVDLGAWHLTSTLVIYWNPIVALVIACSKAILVVLYFMHVRYSTRLTMLTVGAGIFMFLALVGMTLSDYISRAWGQW